MSRPKCTVQLYFFSPVSNFFPSSCDSVAGKYLISFYSCRLLKLKCWAMHKETSGSVIDKGKVNLISEETLYWRKVKTAALSLQIGIKPFKMIFSIWSILHKAISVGFNDPLKIKITLLFVSHLYYSSSSTSEVMVEHCAILWELDY